MSHYLGLDVGGTKCAAVIGDERGTILARTSWPSDAQRGPAPMIADLVDAARSLMASWPVRAAGVAIGGPLDSQRGVIHSPPNLPGWDAVPLKDELESALGLAVTVEHDAAACALAEYRWGAGAGATRLAYLTCGTGLGVGLVFDGAIYRGAGGNAPDFGHISYRADGPEAYGKRGSLESYAAASAIARLARWRHPHRWSHAAITAPRTTAARATAAARDTDAAAIDAPAIHAAAHIAAPRTTAARDTAAARNTNARVIDPATIDAPTDRTNIDAPATAAAARNTDAANIDVTDIDPTNINAPAINAAHIVAAARDTSAPTIDAAAIAALAASGDADAAEILELNARAVGDACALLADLLYTDVILLGSLARYLGDTWLAIVRAQFDAAAHPRARSVCRIAPAGLAKKLQDCSSYVAAIRKK